MAIGGLGLAVDKARRERMQKAYAELEAQNTVIANAASEWKGMEDFFAELEAALDKKLKDLEEREKEFEVKTKEAYLDLERRESSIASREEASVARVEEQKAAALASIEEERQKWIAGKEGKPELVAVVAQTKKTAKKQKPEKPVPNSANSAEKPSGGDPNANANVKVRQEITKFVSANDGEGLATYMAENEKIGQELREEVPCAFHQTGVNPTNLVINALSVYLSGSAKSNRSKKMGAYRRACDKLLDVLLDSSSFASTAATTIPLNDKVTAKKIADVLKPVKEGSAKADPKLGDEHFFLKLLVAFGIGEEYDKDKLIEYVAVISHRKRVPFLCKPLGLTEKMPQFVERLVKEGKRLEALRFAQAFDIMDTLSPVELLRDHLNYAKQAAAEAAKKASNAAAGFNESVQKELGAAKSVIQAIEEYSLESQYPNFDGLKKRVAQLEKSREEKRKVSAANKARMAKKPRLDAGNQSSKKSSGGGSEARIPPPYGGGASLQIYPGQGPPPPSYGSTFRNPSSLSSSYLSSIDRVAPSAYPAPSLYGNAPLSLGEYQIGAASRYPFLR